MTTSKTLFTFLIVILICTGFIPSSRYHNCRITSVHQDSTARQHELYDSTSSLKAHIDTLDTLTLDYDFKYLNDSIANLISRTKKITCSLESLNPIDTLRTDSLKVLPRRLNPIVQFLLLDPSNFESNDIVYGFFHSDVCYKLSVSRKKVVYLQLDFGLGKLKLLDSDKREICTTDMKKNNLHFLRFTLSLFPEDITLNILNNSLNN